MNCTFPGDQYWRFSADKTPSGDYPKKINQGFPGIAERNLDAGMITNSPFHLFFSEKSFERNDHFYSGLDKCLLGVFYIFWKWPLKFWSVIRPKDSLVLG